ncbi:MAG TPA: hypothetical protein PK765_06270 [bacterium]|nr:hypothetical protein [bacterium]
MLLGLLYSIVFAFALMSVVGFGRISFPNLLSYIPLPTELANTCRRAVSVVGAFFAVATGKQESFDLASARQSASMRSDTQRSEYLADHPDHSLPFAPELLLIPGFSLFFVIIMTRRHASVYRQAYGQGLVLSALLVLAWSLSAWIPPIIESFIFLGFFVLAAYIRTAPETELPIIGLIARFLGSFGSTVSHARASVAEKSEKREVKLKVGE